MVKPIIDDVRRGSRIGMHYSNHLFGYKREIIWTTRKNPDFMRVYAA